MITSTSSSVDAQARSWTLTKALTSKGVSEKIASPHSRSSRQAYHQNSITHTHFNSQINATLPPVHLCPHLEESNLHCRTLRSRLRHSSSLRLHRCSRENKTRVCRHTCYSSWRLSLDSCCQDSHCFLVTIKLPKLTRN